MIVKNSIEIKLGNFVIPWRKDEDKISRPYVCIDDYNLVKTGVPYHLGTEAYKSWSFYVSPVGWKPPKRGYRHVGYLDVDV